MPADYLRCMERFRKYAKTQNERELLVNCVTGKASDWW